MSTKKRYHIREKDMIPLVVLTEDVYPTAYRNEQAARVASLQIAKRKYPARYARISSELKIPGL